MLVVEEVMVGGVVLPHPRSTGVTGDTPFAVGNNQGAVYGKDFRAKPSMNSVYRMKSSVTDG